jgi:transcription elongation factor GreA
MQIPKRKSEQKNPPRKIDPHITSEKYNQLKKELEKIKKFSQPPAAKEVIRLAEMGDFSENAAYQMAKGKLRRLNQRLLEIEDQLTHSIIIEPPTDSSVVQLGSKVTIENSGQEQTYTILGSEETNPGQGKISNSSPIGMQLMGQKVGQKIRLKIKNKEIEFKIIKIA